MAKTTAGPSSQIESLLDEYGVGVNSWVSDVFASDTDRLLLALLLEERNQELIEALEDSKNTTDDETATYWSQEVTATAEWSDAFDLGFKTDSVDLRVSNAAIEIAFADPSNGDVGVPYTPEESPVIGVPVSTTQLWVRRAPSASSNATVQIDAWGE